MCDIGYRRVSTFDQNTDRQLDGLELQKVFEDKASGSTVKRPGLEACLDYCREGDTLHIHSIDRLARNLIHLEKLVKAFTDKGVVVQFHKEGLTFSPGGNGSSMNKLLFQVMGAFAEFERSLLNERTAEGRAKAMSNGVRFGAKRRLSDEQLADLKRRKASGESVKSLQERFGLSRAGVYKVLKYGPAGDG